jgi:2-methylcitrate dehydratase
MPGNEQQTDATTQKLCRFTRSLRYEDLPAIATLAAKSRILSTLGVALAAYDMAPVRIVRKLAQPVAAGAASSIFGSLVKTTPDMAAFVNSAMVRCLDMSDTYVMKAVSHPADAFPAVLAVAQAEGASGKDLLLATAIIYEIQCRFVEVVPYNHLGWDQTPVVALGAALGCGRLLGLDEERLRHAIGLAVVPNIALNQTRTGTLSMWKGMAGPQGARAGVFAAYLAREGMTAPDGVFAGQYGFWNQLMNGEQFDIPLPREFSQHTFAVQQTMIKLFPTRFNCQVPVLAAQKLRRKVDVRAIESLKIESIRQAFDRWVNVPEVWKPQTRETADHSLPCTVSMALLDGTITPAMMEAQRFMDGDVLQLMGRCTIELPDEFADIAPAIRCCRLTARLRSGETVIVEERRSLEDDAADPGWNYSVEKFSALAADALAAGGREKVIASVENLDRQPTTDEFLEATRLRAA